MFTSSRIEWLGGGSRMAYDVELFLSAVTNAGIETRLTAVASLEHALKAETGPLPGLVDRVLPALLRGLGDSYKGVQVHSANCLALLSEGSAAVVPALRETMAGPDAWQAWGAALVTARMGHWFPEMGPALSAAMGSADRDVRWAAAGYAFQLGRTHPAAVAMVKETLVSPNPLARKMATYCLGAMGGYAPVETALSECLGDPERDVRRAAIVALSKLPEVSAAMRNRVAELRADPDEHVRRTAAAVAAQLGA